MMNKRFWDDPYQTSLKTTVTQVNGAEVLLAETIAFSFSGGQESDRAHINDIEVLNSRIEGKLIYYLLPEGHNLTPGQQVDIIIDWPRRYRLMRLHFAAELILELVTRKHHLEKVGAHISESKARIDFLWDQNISSIFEALLTEYKHIIDADLPIHKDFSDEENQRRYWKIDGFAEVPCGGTHVRTTGEVGYVSLKRTHPGKGIERIEIRLEDADKGL